MAIPGQVVGVIICPGGHYVRLVDTGPALELELVVPDPHHPGADAKVYAVPVRETGALRSMLELDRAARSDG